MKLLKLAILRENDDHPCPFLLDIQDGCLKAGELVNSMASVDILGENASEEEIEQLKAANISLLNLKHENKKCIYADKIIKDKNIVECSFGEDNPNATEGSVPLPAPYYAKNYNNVGFDGVTTLPIGYYADYDMSRNMYYGLYSLQGDFNHDDFLKFASYVNYLNASYDFLEDEIKFILAGFANNCANKSALLKKAAIFPEFNKVAVILNKWKKLPKDK